MARKTNAGNFHRQPLILPPEDVASPGKQPNFIVRIYSLLDQHLPDPSISVNWLANQLAINRKTLYRKVQCLSQLTPTDLIRQYRLHKAVELLRIGYSVTKTAGSIGFKTSSHFAAVFKEVYRQTPTDFIASQKKNT
ncbi:helix-turn-helix domain-containing protein [Spirosoma endophyticum]|uniref:AraC-type DNA-binding protein n=1 Tax=Spirosoma endophyticum TaxID=662367 RepID=A0A1I1FRL6_9BACT|nr:AraC family transcriptional regulator [Spirosoma endophyticum]SFC00248.1 AraC-type DNA-binding protein [Spirosoma endophyticum]